MNGWLLLPDGAITTDAPSDNLYYARRNHAWEVVPAGAQPFDGIPLQDGIAVPGTNPAFSRGDHVHPTDTSRYSVSNPSNYQTLAQVLAAVAPMMPRSGGQFTGTIGLAAGAIFDNGPSTFKIVGATPGKILVANASQTFDFADLPTIPPPVIISDTPPASPVAGTLWWDSVGGQMYVWYVDSTSPQWVAVVNEVGAYLSLAGGQVTGPIDLKAQVVAQSGGVLTINRALGENVVVTLTASITSVVVVGWPISGFTAKTRIIFINGGAFTLAGWPAGTIWPAAAPPILTIGAGKKDIVLLMSDDGGATIYGSIVGQDYR
jgi:hypothetical protein